MCTTSGQAAVLLSLLNICNAGDRFISTTEIYGGSVNLFSHTFRRLGIANPALTVFDMERFAAIAHKHGVPLIIDNTFATPILCKPFKFGADIIVHSTSKPDLTEPDESYHGISYTETYGKKAYIVKARMQLMRGFGVYPAAHSAFLLNLIRD
jgi:O-acetylhomoserine (thiol)-lyase